MLYFLWALYYKWKSLNYFQKEIIVIIAKFMENQNSVKYKLLFETCVDNMLLNYES